MRRQRVTARVPDSRLADHTAWQPTIKTRALRTDLFCHLPVSLERGPGVVRARIVASVAVCGIAPTSVSVIASVPVPSIQRRDDAARENRTSQHCKGQHQAYLFHVALHSSLPGYSSPGVFGLHMWRPSYAAFWHRSSGTTESTGCGEASTPAQAGAGQLHVYPG